MGDKKRAGFPEQALDKFLGGLVQKGFKVVIVEQTETDKELQERLKMGGVPKHLRVLQRGMIDVQSKATFQTFEDQEKEED